MIASKRLAAALAFGAGLTAAGMALAQTQTGATPPPPSAQPAPSTRTALPAGTLPSAQSQTPAMKPGYTDSNLPTYGVDPPPDTPSWASTCPPPSSATPNRRPAA